MFICCLMQSWPSFSTLNLKTGFEMPLITSISIFFSYFKVYISCLLGEYLLFQKFNVKIVINVIDVVV